MSRTFVAAVLLGASAFCGLLFAVSMLGGAWATAEFSGGRMAVGRYLLLTGWRAFLVVAPLAAWLAYASRRHGLALLIGCAAPAAFAAIAIVALLS